MIHRLALLLALALPVASAQEISNVPPPAHPATEATLRQYFEVCHFASSNRLAMEQQFAQQQRQLPVWFPQPVWQQMVQSVLDLDAVRIAIPIYQRYFTEEAARNAVLIFATPDGQAMINKVYEKTLQSELAGDSAAQADRKALDSVRDQENSSIHNMLNSISPADHRKAELYMRSAEWIRIDQLSGRRNQDFGVAYRAEQEAALHQVVAAHRPEIAKAHADYLTAHPDYKDPTP